MSNVTSVTTSDGRLLQVSVSGPQDGIALVAHHGTPGAAGPWEPFVAEATKRGLRHVEYSRPGYGGSARSEGRAVADCAADVAAILDALEASSFYTYGWSGGGPHALACAALLGDRVIRAASIASVAPWGSEGLDWLAGMGEENHAEFGAALAGADELRAYLEAESAGLAQITGETIAAGLGDLVGEADRRALQGGFADHLAGLIKAATVSGIWGWFDDDVAFTRDWGFALDAIAAPVTVWHGTDDRFVPVSHGEWLARAIPGADAKVREGEGHISVALAAYGSILDDLCAAG
jgi:pimeloyl-ACP methyl ester carboxylesterase